MLTIYGAPPSIHTRKVIVAALQDSRAVRRRLSRRRLVGHRRLSRETPCARRTDPRRPGNLRAGLWFEEYADGAIAPLVQAMFREKLLGPMKGRPADAAAVEELVGQLAPCLDYLEQALGEGYLAGQALSIADVAVVSNLVMYHYLGHTLDGGRHPKLLSHLARTLARPSFRKALSAERPYIEKLGLDADALSGVT